MTTNKAPLNEVEVTILDPRIGTEFPMPQYQMEGDAGIDLVACIDSKLVLHPKDSAALIPTGLSVYVRDPNYAAIILPRSSTGHKKGLVLGNLVGLIDSKYQGPLMVSAWNRNTADPIIIEPGDRIAQLVFVPIARPGLKFVEKFSEKTARGEGGFGSTGK